MHEFFFGKVPKPELLTRSVAEHTQHTRLGLSHGGRASNAGLLSGHHHPGHNHHHNQHPRSGRNSLSVLHTADRNSHQQKDGKR